LTLGELTAFLKLDDSGFKAGLGDAEGRFSDFAAKSAKLAAAAATGVGAMFAAGIVGAMDVEKANDKLAAQLGATGQRAGDLGKIAGDLYAGAYGESMEQVNEAIRGVIQSGAVMEGASNEQIQSVTAKVLDLATAFDQDLGATTNAVGQMIRTGLAANADEAMDILTVGMQQGADASGDLLDTFVEYPALFQRLGIDGQTAMGLIEQGMAGGARNADLVADALKEFQIRATDGSKTSAEAFQALGLSAKDMTAQIAGGGEGATKGLDTILDRLRGMEDPVARNAAAVGLFGTQAEDLGEALFAMDPSEAVAALGDVAGAADKMGATLNDNAATNLEAFKRQATQTFVDIFGGKVLPVVNSIASTLATQFGPAVSAASTVLSGTLLPAARSVFDFLAQHQTTVSVIAGLIGGVLVAALSVWAVRSTVAAATNTVAWFTTAAASTTSAATQSKSALQVVVGWVLMGTQAAAQGIKIAAVWTAQIVASAVAGAASFAVQAARVVAGWVLMAAQAVAHGAVVAAQWAMAAARVVASLAVMAAQFVAQGAVMAASMAATAARVVAGWVLMGAQALIQAARMAAAWFIALGPIGWAIAAVIAVVALIIANWDKVVAATKAAWSAVSNGVINAWNWIKSAVSAAVSFVVGVVTGAWNAVRNGTINAWNNVRNAVGGGVDGVVSFVRSLPGKILSALGNMGSLLWNAGKSVIDGFINGIKSAFNTVRSTLSNLTGMLPDWKGPAERDAVILRNAGRLVMQGFENGLVSKFGDIRDTLGGLTSQIGGIQPTVALASAPVLRAPVSAVEPRQSGPLFTVDRMTVVEGTADDVARKLALEARTR